LKQLTANDITMTACNLRHLSTHKYSTTQPNIFLIIKKVLLLHVTLTQFTYKKTFNDIYTGNRQQK